eukprot:CAMPEP_0116930556 /NCGR_PEP_ID=MMETSP0467-20121206/27274_1 /TAXON_ID=283647 /ORGANISM="Mesodinium pulex, Strain SPMC105" /LENGTH=146 /DNA_ID=CAMNT_0004610793 /DNA_START=153 /DNA_END=593 /DNA_ORIENTATION=+
MDGVREFQQSLAYRISVLQQEYLKARTQAQTFLNDCDSRLQQGPLEVSNSPDSGIMAHSTPLPKPQVIHMLDTQPPEFEFGDRDNSDSKDHDNRQFEVVWGDLPDESDQSETGSKFACLDSQVKHLSFIDIEPHMIKTEFPWSKNI